MKRIPVLLVFVATGVLSFGAAPASAGWSFPETISGAPALDPDVAVNAKGDAIVAWHVIYRDDRPGYAHELPPRPADPIETRYRPALGSYGETERVAPGRAATPGSPQPPALSAPSVAIAADGTAFVAWTVPDTEDGPPGAVHVMTRPPGGSFGQEEVMSAAADGYVSQYPLRPQLVADARGDLVLAWEAFADAESVHSGNGVLIAAHRAVGGRFAPAGRVSTPNAELQRFALDVNGAGVTALLWQSSEGSGMRVASGTASGGLGQPVDLGASLPYPNTGIGDPSVTVDPRGDIGAAWAVGGGPTPGGEAVAAIQPAGTRTFHLVRPLTNGAAQFGAALAIRDPEDFVLGFGESGGASGSHEGLNLLSGGLNRGLRSAAFLPLSADQFPYAQAFAAADRIWFTYQGENGVLTSVTTDSKGRFLEPQPGGGARVGFDALGRAVGVSFVGDSPENLHIVASDLALDTPSIGLAGIARKRERRGTAVRRNNAALRVVLRRRASIHVELRAPGRHGARIRLKAFGASRSTPIRLRDRHGHTLRPGLYRASAVAVDVRGKRSRLIKLPLRVRR